MNHSKEINKNRKLKKYCDIRIETVENGYAICYGVEYEPMSNHRSHFDHYEGVSDKDYGLKEVFESNNEKKDSTLDRALARMKEMINYSSEY